MLTNNTAQGILVQNVREFTLENDVIKGSAIFTTSTSAAVHLKNVTKATLDNLYTLNTAKGIFIEASSDVTVKNCLLENHESENSPPSETLRLTITNSATGAGVWIADSMGVSVEGCHFQSPGLEGTGFDVAFHIDGLSEDIRLVDSTFSEWYSTINALKVDNLVIDHCDIKSLTNSTYHAIQLGDCTEGSLANSIIIQNTNIRKYPTEQIDFDGIILVQGAGCLIDNSTISSSSFGYNTEAAALHVGISGCATYSDVLVKNSSLSGPSSCLVHLESARNVTVDNCQLGCTAGFGVAVKMTDSIGSLIKNCAISNAETGVHLYNTTGKNSVVGCQIWGCYNKGILVEEFEGSAGNHISDNSVYWNDVGIAIPIASNTELFYNSACNNSIDCENPYPNNNQFIAQSPGDFPVLAGSNLCCSVNIQD